MLAQTTTVDEARSFLAEFTTVEERVAVTVAFVVLAAALGWALLPRLVDRLETGTTQWAVTSAVTQIVKAALVVGLVPALAVVWGYSAAVDQAVAYLDDRLTTVGRALGTVVVLLVAYVGARVLRETVSDLGTRTEWITEHQEEIVLRVSQLCLFALAGLVALGIWNVQLGGLLVGAGFLGIVVGFAARQTLGSLIAGFVLMFSRPFTIGDWVQIGDQQGIVTDITIFNTRLENFDGEFIVIPNDQVSNQAIVNRSQKGLLRIRIDVGVDYGSDPDHAADAAMEAIGDCEEVVDAPAPQVFPKRFGDSAVVLELRFWIDHPTPPRKWKAVSAVVSSVKEAFGEEGIKIPFPQREVSGRAETGGFRVQDAPDDAEEAVAEPRDR